MVDDDLVLLGGSYTSDSCLAHLTEFCCCCREEAEAVGNEAVPVAVAAGPFVFLCLRNNKCRPSGSAAMMNSIISSKVSLLMVTPLMDSSSSPNSNFPDNAAAPVRGNSQIRTPVPFKPACVGIGSKTIPMGFRRVSRIRPEEEEEEEEGAEADATAGRICCSCGGK